MDKRKDKCPYEEVCPYNDNCKEKDYKKCDVLNDE